MKARDIWMTAAAMTFALGAGIAAQSTGASSNTIQQSRNVTVTGCLQSVDQPASRPTGSASPGARPSTSNRSSASSSANRFMLTGATTGAASATSRDSSRTAAATGGTYILEGQAAELRLHANHQVEISGQISSSYTSSSSASGQRLNVSSVRTISSSCSR